MENRLEKVSRKWAASLGETFQANSLQLSYLLCVCRCVCVCMMCVCIGLCAGVCCVCVRCLCFVCAAPHKNGQITQRRRAPSRQLQPQQPSLGHAPCAPISLSPSPFVPLLHLSLSLALLFVPASFCWPFCRWPTAVLFGFVLFWSCGCHF